MAIYRAETKHISRGKNHNVVAAAAYRAGEKLTDTNKYNPDATTHDYTKKHGVLAKDIVLPDELKNQGFSINRQDLWSGVEQSETTTRSVKGSRLKQKSRLAREWLLSLPHELSDAENEELTREFTTTLVNELGVIADYAIHKPTVKNYSPKKDSISYYDDDDNELKKQYVGDIEPTNPDPRNVHAHIMFTTRKAELINGKLSYGDKADSERSEKWRKDNGLVNGGDYLKQVRSMWETLINKRLESKNIQPVSAKSYKDMGLDIEPQRKRGKSLNTLMTYEIDTQSRIKVINNDIDRANRAVIKSTADSIINDGQWYTTSDNSDIAEADNYIADTSAWLSRADNILQRQQPSPFDAKRAAARVDEQADELDRQTERADREIDQQPNKLINKAIEQYRAVRDYEPYIQLSDFAGGGTRPNADPNPRRDYTGRQLDTIDSLKPNEIRAALQADNRLVTLILDPQAERKLSKPTPTQPQTASTPPTAERTAEPKTTNTTATPQPSRPRPF